MRKLFIIIALLSFIKCEKDPTAHHEKFFDPQKLPQLSLEKVNSFWQDDSIKHIYMDGIFSDSPGFLNGISYWGNEKGIHITVFKSQAMAIEAMEFRRKNVASVIEPGNLGEIFKGRWWFTGGIPNAVFVNQWNTIIEVHYYHANYEEIKALLIETAAEIAKKIDSLSD